MLNVILLSLSVPLLANGASTDVAVGGDLTNRTGLMAVRPDEATEVANESTLLLLSGVKVESERTTFVVQYSPRLYLLVPNAADTYRPLFLQQGYLDYQTALSARTNLIFSHESSLGEVTYTALQQVLAPGAGAVNAPVVPLVSTRSSGSVSHQISRVNTVTAGLRAGYRSPLRGADADLFPTSYNAILELSESYRASLRDELGVDIEGGYIGTVREAEPSAPEEPTDSVEDIVTLGLSGNWSRTLSPRSNFGLNAGAVATKSEGQSTRVFPTLGANHQTEWTQNGDLYQSNLNGGLRAFFDPTTVTLRPQLYLDWTLTGTLGRDWSASATSFLSTSLAPEPIVPTSYETYFGLEIPAQYQINPRFALRMGARGSIRAPHLTELGALPHQRELTGYVGLRYTTGTGRPRGSWLR